MKIVKNYLLNCSFHGIPYTVDKRYHWSERFFWVIMVILSWLASVYIMFSSYEQYLTSGISFTAETSYLGWKSNFPAIIFCEKGNDKHTYFTQKLFGDNYNYQLPAVLKDLVFFQGAFQGASSNCGQKDFDCPFNKTYFTAYGKVRSSCDELFAFCSVNEVEFDCCKQIVPIATIYGKCFALNSIASSPQPKHPLNLIVSYEVGEDAMIIRIEILNSDLKVLTSSREGVPTYTDDSNVVMDGVASSKHEKVQINAHLKIKEILNDQEVRNTDIERRECRFPEESNLKSKVYSYEACISECLIEIQLKKCGCNHHLMPAIEEKNICDMKGLACLTKAFDAILAESFLCNCLSCCTNADVRIAGTVTVQNYSRFYKETSITQLKFVLPAPTLRYVRKVVIGNLDLIVSLGGTAGLCVGASLLTIVEIIYYLFVRPFNDYQIERYRRKAKLRLKNKKLEKPPFPFRL